LIHGAAYRTNHQKPRVWTPLGGADVGSL
jgi:hypothetical protein